ncbi:PREDICTED: testicular haploid expressed gene protein isoform X2 [Chinchilla lanigera]|uniref:Sperm microtubule associated protein 2 n=1 Tax=Chinchilla lanigera TaxID=34839 RepID=A0A8C2VRK8_CHILA|nr:PREDICTED: testicular haploid expressed gene protein isoform X2 [Chinchilla lanigera]
MGERRQSLRGTHFVPEAGSQPEGAPENGEEGSAYQSLRLREPGKATPGPGVPEAELPLEEVAGERHLKVMALEDALDQDVETNITMSRLSITERYPDTSIARGRRRRRLQELAKPKTDWQVVRDRPGCCCEGFVWISPRKNNLHFCLYWPSVYWTERFLEDTTLAVTVPAVSRRVEELARPRRFYLEYFNSCRASPIWSVPRASLDYRASGRLRELATPKVRNNIWSINMSEVSQVSRAAQTAVPSSRILQLAKPRAPATVSAEWDPMPKPKPYASDYGRLVQLAMPKAQSEKCVPDRSPRWEVLDITKKAVASPRIISLAQPKVRKDLNEDYNPYYISPASLVARASPRLYELATPKSITKKV